MNNSIWPGFGLGLGLGLGLGPGLGVHLAGRLGPDLRPGVLDVRSRVALVLHLADVPVVRVGGEGEGEG